MWPKSHGYTFPWITSALLILVVLVGCAEVEIVDKTPVADTPDQFYSPLPGEHGKHNLAVMAVDFDPALSYTQLIVRREAVALLVVVENRGNETERGVVVRVQLSTPENPNLVLSQDGSVESIAPGEVQIVRFADLGQIPYHQAYHLAVAVDPVAGEIDLSDNSKAFEIQIHHQ